MWLGKGNPSGDDDLERLRLVAGNDGLDGIEPHATGIRAAEADGESPATSMPEQNAGAIRRSEG